MHYQPLTHIILWAICFGSVKQVEKYTSLYKLYHCICNGSSSNILTHRELLPMHQTLCQALRPSFNLPCEVAVITLILLRRNQRQREYR